MPMIEPERPPPPPTRPDVRTLLWHAAFALILMVPLVGLIVGGLVAVLSVPVLVALFPVTISLGAIALAVLYWRHRRARGHRRIIEVRGQ